MPPVNVRIHSKNYFPLFSILTFKFNFGFPENIFNVNTYVASAPNDGLPSYPSSRPQPDNRTQQPHFIYTGMINPVSEWRG